MKLAIVGRRNVGKSTLVNTLVQAERMITSEIPGTTRDSVDVRFELDGKLFIAIDTPGFRRGKSVDQDVDFYSTHRAERSIRRADVVLLFFDASQRISKVDKQLCDYIAQQYKPCMFVVNKWDLVASSMPTDKWVAYLRDTFRTMLYAPIAFIRASRGRTSRRCSTMPQMLFKQSRMRIGTAQLNKLVPRRWSGTRRRRSRTAARESFTPPKWPSSRRPSSCFATTRRISQQYQRYLSACSARSWVSAKCPSSCISASAEERPPRRDRRKDRQREEKAAREEADAERPEAVEE